MWYLFCNWNMFWAGGLSKSCCKLYLSVLERVLGWRWRCSGQRQAWQLPTVQPTNGSGGRHAPTGGGAAVTQQTQVDQLLQLLQKDACIGQIGNHYAMLCSCWHFPPQTAAATPSLPLQQQPMPITATLDEEGATSWLQAAPWASMSLASLPCATVCGFKIHAKFRLFWRSLWFCSQHCNALEYMFGYSVAIRARPMFVYVLVYASCKERAQLRLGVEFAF